MCATPETAATDRPQQWAKVLDQGRCIGCHACTTACKSENEVPLSVTRTYVKSVEVGVWPQARRAFQVTRCNQCADAPCVSACPTSAMFQRADGIVDFDKRVCIGCKACIAACPYDAIFINPEDHSAEKCNFCTHRLEVGLEPACVVVCPVEAIFVGDILDPASKVARVVNRDPVTVRRPEKETKPKVFYKDAHQVTLDPLAARRPEGENFMWSEQARGPQTVNSGHPAARSNSSAAALLSYDVRHEAPWDWRVSAYTWTKGIAAGSYLVALAMLFTGAGDGTLFRWVAPVLAVVFLALTGALLVWDLEHPERFYLIFTRPQWRSWLARGAVVISAYGAVLAAHLLGSVLGWTIMQKVLAVVGVPLAAMTSVYTAYLFAQAKARDLWQNPLLPAHLLVQSLLGGAAALLLLAPLFEPRTAEPIAYVVAGGSLVHLLMVWGEITLVHVTAHAHLAQWFMTNGDFKVFFWTGVGLVAVATAAPVMGVLAAPFALAGLWAYEHAYVQAAQAVPLA
ncbi:MAG: polysulfide reductase NrfD [Actinobacteria bacterium]|nr:polysulfide reductase NrfD [Actinomycetota bacterium]